MTFPDDVASILPKAVLDTWRLISGSVPNDAYLVGGTAVAAHLAHRASRDLDFFLEAPVDLDALEGTLAGVGALAVTARDDRTLNTVIGSTVVQFLDASDQRVVEPTHRIEGLRVAGLGDLLATKLHAITTRPALRDYVDLRAMEQRAHRRVEEGLAVFVERYRPRVPDDAIASVVRALASFEDVPDDPGLDVTVGEIADYWTTRVREVTRHLDRWA